MIDVPYHKPYVPRNINSLFPDSLKNGWLTTGPAVKQFESDLSDYLQCENVIAVNSCTAALHMALASKNISQEDSFIAPTYTFVSTVEIGLYFKSKPILIDSDINSFLIDLDRVEHVLKKDKNNSIKFIIPVHFAGQTVDMKNLNYLSERYGVFIIEDAAHALESVSNFGKIGNTDHVSCFSFYANKNITTGGEGGAISTNDNQLANKLRKLSLHGMSKDGWNRFSKGGKWAYDISELGYKYNMTDYAACFGIDQLSRVDEWHQKRLNIVSNYSSGLKHIEGLVLPKHTEGEKHGWHLYIIRVISELWTISRNELIKKLNSNGVGTSVHYIPVHMHSYYIKKYGYNANDFPIANNLANSVITLPLYPHMKNAQVEYVIKILIDIWHQYKK